MAAHAPTDVEMPDAETMGSILIDAFTGLLGVEGEDIDLFAEEFSEPRTTAGVSISGAWHGDVVIGYGDDLARALAGQMFDDDPLTLDDEAVGDALGEFANVIGGTVKSLLPGPSTLSLPYVGRLGQKSPPGQLGITPPATTLFVRWLGMPLVVHVYSSNGQPQRPAFDTESGDEL